MALQAPVMTERMPAGSTSHVGVLEEQGGVHGGPGSLNLPWHATRGGSPPVQPSLHLCEGLQQHYRCRHLRASFDKVIAP